MPAGCDSRANDSLNAHLGSNHSSVFPSTVYLALYTAAPDSSTNTGGTEGGYTGYGRAAVANDSTEWPDASDRRKSNANDITFATPPDDTDDFVAIAVHGHATNDDIIFWQMLPSPIRVLAGESLGIAAGSFLITVP